MKFDLYTEYYIITHFQYINNQIIVICRLKMNTLSKTPHNP